MAYKLHYSDYSTTTGPPDPAAWIGPPGPPGPQGPPGPMGPHGVNGIMAEAPATGTIYGRGGYPTPTWQPVLTPAAGAALPFLPLSGGTVSGHVYMSNHSLLDVAGINSYGYAPLPFANAIQTAGYQFWPPGGAVQFVSGPLKPYMDINTAYTGTIDDTSQTIVPVHRLAASRDTVAAPMSRGLTWLSVHGNVGYPAVWQATHTYALNDQIAWHGRIYQVTTAGTSAASGGPTGTGSAITDGTVVWAYRSPNNTGDRTALYGQMTVTSEAGDFTAGKAGGAVFCAVGGSTQINYNQGGTDLVNNAAGGIWGANFLAGIGNTATNIGALAGVEIDISVATGTSIKNKVGLSVVQTTLDRVAATNGDDIAIFVGNQEVQGAGPPGWRVGLGFGGAFAGFPMAPTGTMIGAATLSGTMHAGNGIDFSGVTFSGYSLRLPGFRVQGDSTADASMNGLVITPGSSGSAPIAFTRTGTGGYQFDANITTAGWFLAPGDTSQIGLGSTNTLYLQGGVQPEIQVVGSAKMFFLASGGFQFNGPIGFTAVPISRPTVTGAKGSNAALASLMTALAAYGLVTDSTSA